LRVEGEETATRKPRAESRESRAGGAIPIKKITVKRIPNIFGLNLFDPDVGEVKREE